MKIMKTHGLQKMFALAGLFVLGAFGHASMSDATIKIDRALNSPTLTVHYSGASASVIDLRVNGESVATRTLSGTSQSGDTNFTLDLSSLRDGDNIVEVRLLDRSGHVVGSEKTTITTDSGTPAPFFISAPKVGQTVEGPVEISIGFSQQFPNSYVSFFVDNHLKSMSNTPPFTYVWDTGLESNGWHELESWLVDDSSTTYKTRKIRVFVNNPSGHTKRHFESKTLIKQQPINLAPKRNSNTVATVGASVGMKHIRFSAPVAKPASNKLVAPTLPTVKVKPVTPFVGAEKINKTSPSMAGSTSGLKPVGKVRGLATGIKHLTPTGTRYAMKQVGHGAITAVKPVITASHLIAVKKGTRLQDLLSFSIVMDGSFIDFDVLPSVQSGVPMTPLRYLLEKAGGKVEWANASKTVTAQADGHKILVQVGNDVAKVGDLSVQLEKAAYLEGNRTIVPLSFIREALKVDVQYDKATGHVLITSLAK